MEREGESLYLSDLLTNALPLHNKNDVGAGWGKTPNDHGVHLVKGIFGFYFYYY
jgi:hypothetical protein